MLDLDYKTCKICNGFAEVCATTSKAVDECDCSRYSDTVGLLRPCPVCQSHKYLDTVPSKSQPPPMSIHDRPKLTPFGLLLVDMGMLPEVETLSPGADKPPFDRQSCSDMLMARLADRHQFRLILSNRVLFRHLVGCPLARKEESGQIA